MLRTLVMVAALTAATVTYGQPVPSGVLEETQAYHAPSRGWPQPYAYGFPVRTYRWGWFGTHYRPRMHSHWSYHGDFMQWGYRKGY